MGSRVTYLTVQAPDSHNTYVFQFEGLDMYVSTVQDTMFQVKYLVFSYLNSLANSGITSVKF